MLKHGQVVSMISSSWVIVVDPFFITSDYTMQKILSFMPDKQHFTCEKSAFNVSRLQFIWKIPLLLNPKIIPNDFKRYEIVCLVTPNVSASSFCVCMNLHPIMLPIPRVRTLSIFRYVLCLRRQIHRSKLLKPLTTTSLT